MLLPQKSAIAYRHKLNDPAADQKSVRKSTPIRPEFCFSARAAASTETYRRETGSQQMEGLLVIGRRTTMTIPAGAEGNDRALTIVSESGFPQTWASRFWKKPPTRVLETPKGK